MPLPFAQRHAASSLSLHSESHCSPPARQHRGEKAKLGLYAAARSLARSWSLEYGLNYGRGRQSQALAARRPRELNICWLRGPPEAAQVCTGARWALWVSLSFSTQPQCLACPSLAPTPRETDRLQMACPGVDCRPPVARFLHSLCAINCSSSVPSSFSVATCPLLFSLSLRNQCWPSPFAAIPLIHSLTATGSSLRTRAIDPAYPRPGFLLVAALQLACPVGEPSRSRC